MELIEWCLTEVTINVEEQLEHLVQLDSGQ